MSALISWLGGLGAWFGAQVAAKWGFKIALIAAFFSTYALMWLAMISALGLVGNMMPSNGFTPFLLQFFPSPSAVSTAITAYYGSMLARRSWDFWVVSFGIASKMGSS